MGCWPKMKRSEHIKTEYCENFYSCMDSGRIRVGCGSGRILKRIRVLKGEKHIDGRVGHMCLREPTVKMVFGHIPKKIQEPLLHVTHWCFNFT